jgi:hypothetical protein
MPVITKYAVVKGEYVRVGRRKKATIQWLARATR